MSTRRILIMVVVATMTMMTVNAQNLTGRVYYNANILAGELNKKLKEVEQLLKIIKLMMIILIILIILISTIVFLITIILEIEIIIFIDLIYGMKHIES